MKTETKSEQLQKAIAEAIEAVKPRRLLMLEYYQTYLTQSGEKENLQSEITASFFAQELVTLEAVSTCACYLAYTKIFKAATRRSSSRLQPIRDALKAEGYNFYCSDTLFRNAGRFHCSASIQFGNYGDEDWRDPILKTEALSSCLEKRQAEITGESPAEIISRAETACNAWKMQEAAKVKYTADTAKLRKMFGRTYMNDWHRQWTATAGY